MQVLREVEGWDAFPYQWATSGYGGASGVGRTICGSLFGGTVFLGFLQGIKAAQAAQNQDERRIQARESVKSLFRGFVERFGDTDCQTLTGCDWNKEEDKRRFLEEKVYEERCLKYFQYVLSLCLDVRRWT